MSNLQELEALVSDFKKEMRRREKEIRAKIEEIAASSNLKIFAHPTYSRARFIDFYLLESEEDFEDVDQCVFSYLESYDDGDMDFHTELLTKFEDTNTDFLE